MRSVRFIAFAICAAAVGQAAAVNLLANPGFETGTLSPWFNDFAGGGTPWFVQSTEVHTGSFAAHAIGNMGIRQNITPTAVSAITSFTFWIKNPEQTINGVEILYTDNTSDFDIISATSADWHMVDATGFMTLGKTVSGIQIYGYSGGGAAPDLTYVDDFVLEAVPEPASMAVLGLGAAALLRRRKQRGQTGR